MERTGKRVRWGRAETEAAEKLIDIALPEDVGPGDITTAPLARGKTGTGRLVAKCGGTAAGLPVAGLVYGRIGEVAVIPRVEEGAAFSAGDLLMTCEGSLEALVSGERLVLNFVQRLSGTATLAAEFVSELAGTGTKLLDTRKTTPGFRILEKYAVRAGGGSNHRMGLWDMALLKENHIRMAGGIGKAVKAVRAAAPENTKIEVEITNLEELKEALFHSPDRIMLDNMNADSAREAVALARELAPAVELEISGGVNLATIRSYGLAGVDFISVGALTHSAPALDISFLLDW